LSEKNQTAACRAAASAIEAHASAHGVRRPRREIEVLRLVADGRTNQDIATTLHISRGTVKVHVEHILAKLDVSDRTEAAVYASQLGLLNT